MGPPFFIHYKYSYILTYVFVAFTWGGIVPAMFFLSAWGLTIMFVVERMMVYFAYMHPPMLDNQMMEQALNMLYCAPFGLSFMTAWAFSNRAVYYSEVEEVDSQAVYPTTNHEFDDLWKQLTPATPLIIFAGWLLFYAVISICRKPDPLFFEKTFQQDFSK
jgi:hypothetical protein